MDPTGVQSARDVAYGHIREQLILGRIRPGEVLHDERIAAEVSVSRTPVREAIIQLEREGIVRARPRHRPIAAEADPDDLALIVAPLGCLQSLAAAVAAPQASAEDVDDLRRWNETLLDAADAGDIAQARTADIAFHRVLVQRASNRFLTAQIDILELHLLRLQSLYFHNRGPDGRSAAEHQAIIDAVERGDGHLAEQASRDNYLRGLSYLQAGLIDESEADHA